VTGLEKLIRHEFGHSLGIFHPMEAVEMLVDNSMGCTAEDKTAQFNSD
jgi:predicted Zn-dependent protease